MTITKQADEKFCESCGKVIKKEAIICPGCGVQQIKKSSKSRTTTIVLTLFLGYLGVHRFYLGQTGLGFLYLFLCLCGFVSLLVALVDLIAFLAMSDETFNTKYGKK